MKITPTQLDALEAIHKAMLHAVDNEPEAMYGLVCAFKLILESVER